MLVASWAISTAIYKVRRYDELEINPAPWQSRVCKPVRVFPMDGVILSLSKEMSS